MRKIEFRPILVTKLRKSRDHARSMEKIASKCGFTPQYAGLETLYREYSKDGLAVLGFPCNQFLRQEPGDVGTLENVFLVNYGVSFPLFKKIAVKGSHAHPLSVWLTAKLPGIFGRNVK